MKPINVEFTPAVFIKQFAEEKEMSKTWIEGSIFNLILQEALAGKLHCDWYSSRLAEIDEYTEFNIVQVVGKLRERGYHCKIEWLGLNEEFNSPRIRVHISWE